MRNFHILTLDSTRNDLMHVSDYDLNEIDITQFWTDGKIDDKISRSLVLKIDERGKEITDAVGNPLSLYIFSEKLVKILKPFFNDDIQLIEANLLNDKNNNKVEGFKIIHVLKSISCLDIKKSEISYSDENEISIVGTITVIEKKIPVNLHIFRVEEDKNTIVVSDQLAHSLVGNKINGVAFIRCKSI